MPDCTVGHHPCAMYWHCEANVTSLRPPTPRSAPLTMIHVQTINTLITLTTLRNQQSDDQTSSAVQPYTRSSAAARRHSNQSSSCRPGR